MEGKHEKLTIWVLQTGEPLHIDNGNPRPMRGMNVANILVAAGHNVVLWSSAFNHQEKCHRTHQAECIEVSPLLKVRLIPSTGYNRNIGLSRLWDHIVLSRNLKKLLNKEILSPDVAFIGYPPIETAAVMGEWLDKCDVPFVLDVKDLWPSVFLEAVPVPLRPLGRLVLTPYFMLATRCVKRATGITSMANSFLEKMLTFGKRERCDFDGVFPLTTINKPVSENELNKAKQWWDKLGIQDDGKLRLCYVGNLSSNVDLLPVKEAASFFLREQLPVEFVLCGDGVSFAMFKEMMSGMKNVHFPGRVGRSHSQALALRSCASLIPYVNSENFQLSLPNKTLDSLSLGLPILSPLQGEVASLISSHGVGLRYGTDSEKSLIQCIQTLMNSPDLRQEMSNKALNLYQEEFSFEKVYGGLAKHLEFLSLIKRKTV